MATSTSPLLDLAAEISEAARVVNSFLVDNDHAQPSFAADAPPEFPASAPRDVADARRKLIEASRTMYDMACWPNDHIRNLSHSVDIPLSPYLSPFSRWCHTDTDNVLMSVS